MLFARLSLAPRSLRLSFQTFRAAVAAGLLGLGLGLGMAPAGAQPLPHEVDAALQRAKVPREAVTMLVADVDGRQPPRLAWRTDAPMNPASVNKLITTFAALDLLGPAFSWSTPVFIDGAVRNGVLEGNLYIQGSGDPKLVIERLWLLLRRVQGLGIQRIAGDIVLDRSAFDAGAPDPGAFDGRPLRAYNAGPDALLVNYKSVVMTFQPDAGGQTAHVSYAPPLAGVALQASVPLAAGKGGCGDWRSGLRAEIDASRITFAGSYPAACGEGQWASAYADPASFAARAIAGLWGEMGGQLGGQVRDGRVPAGLAPAFELQSPPLAEVIRDINKYSNNVMAEQVFLTIGLQGLQGSQGQQQGSFDSARRAMRQWWNTRIGTGAGQPVFDNGSGLSMDGRVSAAQLGAMLQAAWRSPSMPELMSSLPIVGVDGTLRKRQLRSGATAHLKSGTMGDFGVSAVAGFVDGESGRRYVLVAMINHPNASAARAAFDALVDWTARE